MRFFSVFFNYFFNLALLLVLVFILVDYQLPKTDLVLRMKREPYIKFFDNKGVCFAESGNLQEKIIAYEDISNYLIYCVISAEDKSFFKHYGIDFFAIIRSFFLNLKKKKIVSGASSITQQLAKNILQNEDKTTTYNKNWIRKISEFLMAIKLERKYNKKQIITLYLNRVYFGASCFGIFSISKKLFNKDPKNLNLYESSAIAALLKSPSKFNAQHASWEKRTKKILSLMLKNNYINQKQFDGFKSFKFPDKKNLASLGYFIDYVISLIPYELKTQDLLVYTTLNLDLQKKAYDALQKAYDEAGKEWNADACAMVVISKEGEIVSMIGGLNYNKSQFNRSVQSNRSFGSFFKYYIYLEALNQGLDPNSFINDFPVKIGEWEPSNYLYKSQGKISVIDAFAVSVNSIAVMLLLACSLKKVINLARSLGLNAEISYNPSIALGGMNSSMLEMASTLIPLLNDGYKPETYCIKEIKTVNGKILHSHRNFYKKVLDSRTVWYMWKLLKACVEYGTCKMIRNPNKIIGAKTGTSNDFKDIIFGGATPDYAIAIWFGRDDFQKMNRVIGKNLSILSAKYFIENLPLNSSNLNISSIESSNILTYEDLLAK